MKNNFRICQKAYPKVNLALDILSKSKNGFHKIRTVFCEIKSIFDELEMEVFGKNEIQLRCYNSDIPTDSRNTIWSAAELFKRTFDIKCGIKIKLTKQIPIQSGLGGGSSNAVAMLIGLAELLGIECCKQIALRGMHAADCALRKIADQIGMDCAFFFYGGTALGEHFGEKITPLPALPAQIKFEIIDTGIEISSRDAYGWIDTKKCGKNIGKTKELIEAIRTSNAQGVLENLHNDFEEFVFEKMPQLLKIKREIESKKSGRVLLCGSGGCLVRFYTSLW